MGTGMNSSNFQDFVMYFRKLESEMIPPDIPDSLGTVLPKPGSTSWCLAWTSQSQTSVTDILLIAGSSLRQIIQRAQEGSEEPGY